jgi:hypothetical protein
VRICHPGECGPCRVRLPPTTHVPAIQPATLSDLPSTSNLQSRLGRHIERLEERRMDKSLDQARRGQAPIHPRRFQYCGGNTLQARGLCGIPEGGVAARSDAAHQDLRPVNMLSAVDDRHLSIRLPIRHSRRPFIRLPMAPHWPNRAWSPRLLTSQMFESIESGCRLPATRHGIRHHVMRRPRRRRRRMRTAGCEVASRIAPSMTTCHAA